MPDRTQLFLLLVYSISCCLCYFEDDRYYYMPEDVIVIRPRRSFSAVKRAPITREKRVQMITDLINYMNDAERLRFG